MGAGQASCQDCKSEAAHDATSVSVVRTAPSSWDGPGDGVDNQGYTLTAMGERGEPSTVGPASRRPKWLCECGEDFMNQNTVMVTMARAVGARDNEQTEMLRDMEGRQAGRAGAKTVAGGSHGVLQWSDAERYEGQIGANGMAEGYGRYAHANGNVYEGEWKNSRAHGDGMATQADGAAFSGQWVEDTLHGEGMELWPSGARYEGQYVEGFRSGHGAFYWPSGSSYKGQFALNEVHGQGCYMWADGRRYQGEWRTNQMHGMGTCLWPDGRVYQGQYENDEKCGSGIMQWPDGSRYDGQWQAGLQHGHGKLCAPGEDMREGRWEHGELVSEEGAGDATAAGIPFNDGSKGGSPASRDMGN